MSDTTAPVLTAADLTYTKTTTSITVSGLQTAFIDYNTITDVKIYYSSTATTPTDYVSATSLDSVTISNLQTNTSYNLYYNATDIYGNTNTQAIFIGVVKTDIVPDTIGPDLSSLAISNITSSTFDIVNFNLVTDDRDTNPLFNVYWSLTNTQPATTTKFFNLTYAKSNTIQVDGLTNGKKYYVWVVGEDATGNKTTKELEATTLDNEGPTGTSNLAVGGATANSIDVTGFNLVDDNVKVTEFDIYYATSTTKPTTANVTLLKADAGSKYTITNLTANTGYYVWVDSKDAAGNVTERQVNATAYSTTAAVTTTSFYAQNTTTPDLSTSLPLIDTSQRYNTDAYTLTATGLTFAVRCTWKAISTAGFNFVLGFQSARDAALWGDFLGFWAYNGGAPGPFYNVYKGNGVYDQVTLPTTYGSTTNVFTYVTKLDQANGTIICEIYNSQNVQQKSVSATKTLTLNSTWHGLMWFANSATVSKVQVYSGLKTISEINP